MCIKLVHSIVAYFILKGSRDQGIKGLGHKFESCWAGQKSYMGYLGLVLKMLDFKNTLVAKPQLCRAITKPYTLNLLGHDVLSIL